MTVRQMLDFYFINRSIRLEEKDPLQVNSMQEEEEVTAVAQGVETRLGQIM